MIKKLEEIKKIGAYAVSVFYGEEMGCDDMDVPTMDRHIQVVYSPVGFLGGIRVIWKGKMKDFLNFDFHTKPNKANNPPKEVANMDGFFAWGSDGSIDDFLNKFNRDLA